MLHTATIHRSFLPLKETETHVGKKLLWTVAGMWSMHAVDLVTHDNLQPMNRVPNHLSFSNARDSKAERLSG